MTAKGTFEITMTAEPPYDEAEGVTLARAAFDKRFAGALEATGKVHMLGARTPIADSAGYVALERVTGTLDGKRGSFVLQHTGVMTRGKQSLTITVVPDSGTGALVGLSGRMTIQVVEGRHSYEFEYRFD
jgi:hypothetical protein